MHECFARLSPAIYMYASPGNLHADAYAESPETLEQEAATIAEEARKQAETATKQKARRRNQKGNRVKTGVGPGEIIAEIDRERHPCAVRTIPKM